MYKSWFTKLDWLAGSIPRQYYKFPLQRRYHSLLGYLHVNVHFYTIILCIVKDKPGYCSLFAVTSAVLFPSMPL